MKVETTCMALAMYRSPEMKPSVHTDKNPDSLATEKVTATNGSEVEITLEKDHRISACVVNISGDRQAIKQENMPKELRGKVINDPITLHAYLKDASIRLSVLSDGRQGSDAEQKDLRLEVNHGLMGGGHHHSKHKTREVEVDATYDRT